MKIEIPIITQTDFDLSRFDFSFRDIFVYEIRSNEFKEYIRLLSPDNFEHNFHFIYHLIEEINFDHEKFYAVIKKDLENSFNQKEIDNVHKLLLIVFPSDLQVLHIINYDNGEGFFQPLSMSSWNQRVTGEFPGEFLILIDEYVEEVNEFIKLVFERLSETNYLGISIYHYLSSFDASHIHYQYIALCMVLESMISGSQELTYRLKRNTAVLVGAKSYNCKKIFNNLNKIYDLRSKIVHGELYDAAKIAEYLPYIRTMASRVIIELLLHNFQNNTELNQRITELGYGGKFQITDSYKEYKLNVLTYSGSNWKDL